MYKGEILLSLKNTIPHITRAMCPWPGGLCSQQRVGCCPALECAFSRQPVPGKGKNTHWAPPPGHLWLQGSPRATKSLHLCLLHILLSTFSKRKRGNDVFTVWALPKWHFTFSRQFPKQPLFRALFCVLGGEREKVFKKSHCDFAYHKNI